MKLHQISVIVEECTATLLFRFSPFSTLSGLVFNGSFLSLHTPDNYVISPNI